MPSISLIPFPLSFHLFFNNKSLASLKTYDFSNCLELEVDTCKAQMEIIEKPGVHVSMLVFVCACVCACMCPLVYIFPSCHSMTVSWKTTFENLFRLHIYPKRPQTTNVAKLIPCLLFGMEGEFGWGGRGGGGLLRFLLGRLAAMNCTRFMPQLDNVGVGMKKV
jgi:hypothetical protein